MEGLEAKNKTTLAHMTTVTFIIVYYSFLLASGGVLSPLTGNLLSFIGISIAASMVYKAVRQGKKNKEFWILILLSTISFLIGDLVWAYEEIILKSTIEPVSAANLPYAICSLLLCSSICYIAYKEKDKWNKVQLAVDTIAVTIVYMYIAWVILFKNIVPNLQSFTQGEIFTAAYVALDFILITTVSILFFSNEERFFLNKPTIVYFLGSIIVAVGDFIYSYEVFYNKYVSNGVVDSIWVIGFLVIGHSAICEIHQDETNKKQKREKAVRLSKNKRKVSYIILTIMAVILAVTIKSLKYSLAIFIIIGIHKIISKYIGIAIENQRLLVKQQELNKSLNQKVSESEVLNEKLQIKINEINEFNTFLERKVEERTQELTIRNTELELISKEDSLTKLPNRRWFLNNLDKLILKSENSNIIIGVMFIDLDRFKAVNDWYGHDVGDILLKKVAMRLKAHAPKDAMVARLGGDEFVVVIPNAPSKKYVLEVTKQIQDCFKESFSIKEYKLVTTFSIGISLYPFDGRERSILMKCADIAMYRAKALGKNNFQFYDNKVKEEVSKKLEMENLLRDADYDEEFILHYQPQWDLEGDKIIGLEALIRWKSPTLGLVSPGDFIPIAEEIGIIDKIGEWVLKRVCEEVKGLNTTYHMDLKIAVNISPKQFNNTNFIDVVNKNIEESGVAPKWLDIEITEESAMGNEEDIIEKLIHLKNIGVEISIDDFGTGYSSLSYLKKFSVDKLKIAMPFIRGIKDQREDYQIVKTIIMMAKSLNLRVIAEGVESLGESEILKGLGCDEVQGYYYGKPMTMEEIKQRYLQVQ